MTKAAAFRLFGPEHLATLGLLLSLGLLLVLAGRRARPQCGRRLGRALALLLILYAVTMYCRLVWRGELSWAYSLPLELCHWVLIACVLALVSDSQTASEIAYFWGLGGTLQAVLTPDLSLGFPSWDFVQFFWAHGAILLAVVFLISWRGFRPGKGSVLRMMLAANAYLLVVGGLDLIFGWNYGYLMRPPSHPSLIDRLAPWPWYILELELIALATFCVLALPWKPVRWRGQG